MIWVLLLSSAAAVLLVGLLTTGLALAGIGARPTPPWNLWWRLLGACVLTIGSLGVRSLRWIFLLRRAETRIPIRDAYIGYLAGLSLLITPLLLGEIALRAHINRRRGNVPVLTTTVVNVWERVLDLAALGTIAAAAAVLSMTSTSWTVAAAAGAAAMLVPQVRGMALGLVVGALTPLSRAFEPAPPLTFDRLATSRTWLTAFVASLAAWLLPGLGFWWLAGGWGHPFGVADAEYAYAASTAVSGIVLAPAGVLVAGPQMLDALAAHGLAAPAAALTVLAVRLATVGVSLALGVVFVLLHVRSAAAISASHFDDIADAYDVQIPESRRVALLDRKTRLMKAIIERRGVGRVGLDVGCGQGAYVGRMQALGFDVSGIDASAGQVALAERNVGRTGLVRVGSALDIPAADESFDFLYVINVLHHLGSVEEQRRAFAEIFRVLKPGGLLFVHEINTRNLLFRFYMGYAFPSLNCIDEGIERWLLPHRLSQYTTEEVVDVQYFTFLPDFMPQLIARLLEPIERLLEGSPLRVFSAHYMAVLAKWSNRP